MPKSKKRNYARKVAKRYDMVEFTHDLFEDPFTFPDLKHLNMKTSNAMDRGDFAAVASWLRDAGVEEGAIDAFGSLDREEIPDFMAAWSDGVVTVPKS